MESLIPAWALIPFALMLLCIAVAPLFAEEWWESNLHKLFVSLLLGVPVATWMICNNTPENEFSLHLIHQMVYDYIPFIILLMSLFVVTGGIKVNGDIQANPTITTSFLAIGWVLASFMGTTGAAMLLIRPLISTIQQRKYKTHTILFFIALVANCGGLLTPLGDPPLFLLFLRGASFTWFFKLFPAWAFTGLCLLAIYYIMDRYYYKREPLSNLKKDLTEVTPLSFDGLINIFWLLCVIACVVFLNPGYIPAMGEHEAPFYIKLLREWALIAIIIASMVTTKKSVRLANKFSWAPILEVAVLFIGIFATMTPALMYLNENAGGWGLTETWQFYYSTGTLSSFLDNAPTAVAFHAVAGTVPTTSTMVAGISEVLLKAIATAAVFFGSMTYIGNGPNFMVKAIAEQNGISMPSFFGYIVKFSLVYLLPIYILAQLIFYF